MPALKTHCRQMHLCLGIQETIYLLFHYASLHSGKDKWTIFNLNGERYCVDSKSVGSVGFLGGKERIRIPINSKISSLEALKRHIIEYVGLKAKSEKRGLGSSIGIKLCRLEKSADGSKAYAINNDDNEDEMTFLRPVTALNRSLPVVSTLR